MTCHWFSQQKQENVTVATVTTQKLCFINLENPLLEIRPWDEDILCASHALRKPLLFWIVIEVSYLFLVDRNKHSFPHFLFPWIWETFQVLRKTVESPLLKQPFHSESHTDFAFCFHFSYFTFHIFIFVFFQLDSKYLKEKLHFLCFVVPMTSSTCTVPYRHNTSLLIFVFYLCLMPWPVSILLESKLYLLPLWDRMKWNCS